MRKQIRDAALAAIENLASLTTALIGRRHKLSADQLPAAVIYTDSEVSERINLTGLKNTVELKIRLDVKPGGIDLGEDTTDEILAELDAAVIPAVADIDGVFDVVQDSIEVAGDGETDADYLQTTRTYMVVYHSAA